jgi:uncharacterized protein
MRNSGNRIINPQISDISIDRLKYSVRNLSHIIFEITQDCNLRCKYCSYNDNYFYERKISNLSMSDDIAQKGLEYIFNLVKDRRQTEKRFAIGFYGGEPLLEIGKMKKIVGNAKKLFRDFKLSFNLTTNGTILNNEIIDFFIANDFALVISLDGPEEHHDAKRIFENGGGSFRIVLNNIRQILNKNEQYFRRKVRFSTVFSKDLSLLDIFSFFCNTKIVKQSIIQLSFVNPKNTIYYEKYPVNEYKFVKESHEILAKIERKVKRKDELKSIESKLKDIFLSPGIINSDLSSGIGGACLFNQRLFIDVNGKFHVCEKINNNFDFGDVWQGLNFEKMRKMVEEFVSINENYCRKCDVQFLCKRCYVNFAKDGHFEYSKEYCDEQKGNILSKLKRYVEFNENINTATTKNKRKSTDEYKFHQFVMLEKGYVNTVIIDFLTGNIFQIDNKTIEKFEKLKYEDISEFIKESEEEKLLIKINRNTWIPNFLDDNEKYYFELDNISELAILLEIDDSVDLFLVKEKFKYVDITHINYYGSQEIESIGFFSKIDYKEKNFNNCINLAKVDGHFENVIETFYYSNKLYNSCWGKRIAVTNDRKIRPCIYSEIIIGDIEEDTIGEIILKAKKYWEITKDKVSKCKDCELRYICFDCREIAFRKKGELFDENPYCNYNPYKGIWEK